MATENILGDRSGFFLKINGRSLRWYICMHTFVWCCLTGGSRGRNRMVVGFTTTYEISAYHHWCCEFESRSGRDVLHYFVKFVRDLMATENILGDRSGFFLKINGRSLRWYICMHTFVWCCLTPVVILVLL
jgi:hypothetical protein